jgi:hypothetical protein
MQRACTHKYTHMHASKRRKGEWYSTQSEKIISLLQLTYINFIVSTYSLKLEKIAKLWWRKTNFHIHYGRNFKWFLTYLVGKRNWSRVSASWDHICWKGWGCLRASGRPVWSTVNRLVTANFQVPGDGQPYFSDRGTWSACKSPM